MRANRFLAGLLTLALTACGGSGVTVGPEPHATAASPAASGEASPGASASPASAAPSPIAAVPSTPSPSPSATGATTSGTAAVPFAAATDSDAFYAQPSPFPAGDAPGTILKSKTVAFAPVGGVAMQNQAWLLSFVSRDTNGNPIAATAVVVKPLTPAASPEPLDVVNYAEDSLGAACAPSHTVTGATNNATQQAEGAAGIQGLTLGWTLVYPDTEGPASAYGSGRLAGQIALDAARAAERFVPLGLSAGTPVVITGYSGGAFPAAWAATIERDYAPELKIVGIASGGTPADPKGIANNIDTNQVSNAAFFALIFSAIEGINRSYPTLITPILNAKGVAAATSLENGCVGATSSGASAPTGTLPDYTTVADPFSAPNVEAILPSITLPQSGHAPETNIFVYHSQLDELIPIAGPDAMVAAWCAAGAPVHYYRGVSGDHVAFEASTSTLVYAYLASRIGGAATVTPPGTTDCNT